MWAHSLVYSSSRVVVNLSQTYLPLYLLNTVRSAITYSCIAIVALPLGLYLAA